MLLCFHTSSSIYTVPCGDIVQQRSWCLHLNPLELISEFQQAKDASVATLCTERETGMQSEVKRFF